MARLQDLTGQRFGRLVVLQRAEDYVSPSGKKTTRWLCQCDCGVEKVMLRNTIKRAGSCGCARAEKAAEQIHDLTGRKFGRWTVLEKAPLQRTEANGAKTGWLCRCECGTERILPGRYLVSGRSTSCGCRIGEASKRRIQPDGQNALGRFDGTVISKIQRDAPTSASTTGVRGVYWSERERRYKVSIGLRGRQIYIGRFADFDAAVKARKEAEIKYYAPIIDAYNKEDIYEAEIR